MYNMDSCKSVSGTVSWQRWTFKVEVLLLRERRDRGTFHETNALFAFSVTNATVNSDQYTLLFEMLPVLVVKLKKQTADNERRLHVSVVCGSEKQELNHFTHYSNGAGHLHVIS